MLEAVRWLYVKSLNVERPETTHRASYDSLHKTHYLSFKRIDKIYNNTLTKNHSAPRIKCLDDVTLSPTLLRQQKTKQGILTLTKSSSDLRSLTKPSELMSPKPISKLSRCSTASALQKLVNPDWRRKELMRGSGNITSQAAASTEPVVSTYRATYSQGFNWKGRAERVQRDYHTTFSAGGILPDPTLMKRASSQDVVSRNEKRPLSPEF